jgi:hypothetical protein
MMSPLELAAAFALWLVFLPAPGHPVIKNSDHVSLGLINLEIVPLPDGLDAEAVEFDASGKPKPFSSVDERDVEPCF